MKSKKSPAVTLQAIGKLIDESLDQKLKFTNSKIIGIYGELDGIKQQIFGLDHKIDVLDKKVDEGFTGVYDGLEELGKNIDRNVEPRLKRLETKVFAQ